MRMGNNGVLLLILCAGGALSFLFPKRRKPPETPRLISVWHFGLIVLWLGLALHYLVYDLYISRWGLSERALDSWGLILVIWILVGAGMANPKRSLVREVSPLISSFAWVVVMLAHVFLCSLVTQDNWMRAIPSNGWAHEIREVDTACILNFDYDLDENGTTQPGAANEFLVQWTLRHTNAKLIVAPDIVARAVCPSGDSSPCVISGKEIRRVPFHNELLDEGMRKALFAALDEATKLRKGRIILVAHNSQLQRASAIFEIARDISKLNKYPDVLAVVPEMPETPYPAHGAHFYSQSKYLHKVLEIFVFRIWDAFVLEDTLLFRHLERLIHRH